jgi:hypothetical protein
LTMPHVHFSRSGEVLLAGREQRAPGRDRQTEPYPCAQPSPHARRRGACAPPVRTTLLRLRRDGDCRKTVILSITRALRLHGFPVNEDASNEWNCSPLFYVMTNVLRVRRVTDSNEIDSHHPRTPRRATRA